MVFLTFIPGDAEEPFHLHSQGWANELMGVGLGRTFVRLLGSRVTFLGASLVTGEKQTIQNRSSHPDHSASWLP